MNNYYNKNNKIDKLVNIIVKQLICRNKFIRNYEVNDVLIDFILECLTKKNIMFGFKWLNYIKNINTSNNKSG